MKYIKNFESIEYDTKFNDFSIFIKDFILKKLNVDILLHFSSTINSFWYMETPKYRKHLFELGKIDFYNDDDDMYFDLTLDSRILKNDDYLPNIMLNMILFIDDILKKYSYSQGMIKFSDMQKIMMNIESEYNIFVSVKKYNL